MKVTPFMIGIVILFLIVAKLIKAISNNRKRKELGSSAPSAKYYLPFGLDLLFTSFIKARTHVLFEWTQEILEPTSGRTIELHMLGSKLVLTDEPENVKAIMSSQFSQFYKGELTHKIFQGVLGDSIFTADGESWIASKNFLRPHITKQRPNDLEVTEKYFQKLLTHLQNHQNCVEVYDAIERFQLDVATDIFLGKSVNSLNGEGSVFRDAVGTLLHASSVRMIFGQIGLLFPDWIVVPKAHSAFHKFLDQHVSEVINLQNEKSSIDQGENNITVMEAMAKANFTPKDMKSQLVAILLAAKDPPSIVMAWLLYELAKRPAAVRHLREEILETIGPNNLPTQKQLQSMRYLNNAIQETIRLYHPIGMNIRTVKTDTTLPTGGGTNGKAPVALLAGERVGYSVMGLQRRTDIAGPDSEDWRPERWDSETYKPSSIEYIPFNVGPRICLGRNHGILQMQYTIVRLFQEFEGVETSTRVRPRIKVEMNTKAADPIVCTFYREGEGGNGNSGVGEKDGNSV